MGNNYQNMRPQGGYSQNGGTFNNQGQGGNFNGYGNNQGGKPPKKSGCKTGMMSDGKRRWVSGWKGFGRDHVSFIANPGKNGGECKGENGDRWVSMIADFHDSTGRTWTENCLWDLDKKRLKFTGAGMVANPNAPNGGYFGKGGIPMKINNNR